MKKIITLLVVLSVGFVNAQAFKGKGDIKAQIGANIQDGGTGVFASTDFGIGENMSLGLSANYLLSVDEYTILGTTYKPDFIDRFDLKARFNANIGNVLNIDEKLDIYPGLDLGLRNFGGHIGGRYFFTDGFGVFTEATFPIAKYDTTIEGFDVYNNQFALNLGITFNL
jgi:hypothetical protein